MTVADLAQAVEAFRRDGAAVIRGLISPAEIDDLREGIESCLAAPSERALIASGPDDPGRFFEDFRNWRRIAAFERVVTGSALAETAGILMGSETARFHHDHLLVKEPGTATRTPWHQDQPYYNIDGAQTMSFWIPVDPVERASTLEFVAGSHLGPWLMPRTFRDSQAKWFPPGALADLPDIEADRTAFKILGWALEPGDAVCFHMLTLHAAAGAGPSRRRRVFSARFIGDDVRHAPRPWKTSPEFPGLAAELPSGAPMDHPLFPVLWRRAVTSEVGERPAA
ncbi:MAG TPA: phytanoyl-CoA dioxygenase family protein [Caulobacteraceae bacterium]|nr:phytanoyl-CoA dioxygenase family protein [Caulobacteraceae bacterium]